MLSTLIGGLYLANYKSTWAQQESNKEREKWDPSILKLVPAYQMDKSLEEVPFIFSLPIKSRT
jgi:hypothetical protein